MSIGSNIKERCKELDVSVAELSRQSKIKDSTLRDLIKGKTDPSVDKIKKIAIALHTTTDRLIFDDEEINSDDELKMLFIEIKKMKQENQKIAKEMLKAMVIQNKSQELNKN